MDMWSEPDRIEGRAGQKKMAVKDLGSVLELLVGILDTVCDHIEEIDAKLEESDFGSNVLQEEKKTLREIDEMLRERKK